MRVDFGGGFKGVLLNCKSLTMRMIINLFVVWLFRAHFRITVFTKLILKSEKSQNSMEQEGYFQRY